jgi:hypothetical protein
MFLKELESWLERGQKVPFLREICPRKKCTPNIGANIGSITGILLNDGMIVPFDIDSQKWYFELDDPDDDDKYLIAYEAVCEYSNEQHSAFNRYQLHYEVVLEGDDKILSADGTLYSLTPTDERTRVDDDDNNGHPMLPI